MGSMDPRRSDLSNEDDKWVAFRISDVVNPMGAVTSASLMFDI